MNIYTAIETAKENRAHYDPETQCADITYWTGRISALSDVLYDRITVVKAPDEFRLFFSSVGSGYFWSIQVGKVSIWSYAAVEGFPPEGELALFARLAKSGFPITFDSNGSEAEFSKWLERTNNA